MARREKNVPVTADGRDKGKVYRIVEMPAAQAEKWATRALLALSKGLGDIEIPDSVAAQGMAGVASLGIGKVLSGLQFHDLSSLMDEMFMACVGIFPDPANTNLWRGPGGVGSLVEEDIEEIATRLVLRKEILELHLGFSMPAVDWSSILATAGALANSRTTPTSRARSAPLSPQESRASKNSRRSTASRTSTTSSK